MERPREGMSSRERRRRVLTVAVTAVEADELIVEMSYPELGQEAENAVWQPKGREADLTIGMLPRQEILLESQSGGCIILSDTLNRVDFDRPLVN